MIKIKDQIFLMLSTLLFWSCAQSGIKNEAEQLKKAPVQNQSSAQDNANIATQNKKSEKNNPDNASEKDQQTKTANQKNKKKMLLGKIEVDQLLSEFFIFKANKTEYQPAPNDIVAIKNYDKDVHIIVFLGTWCGDSKRNVPSFLKTLELADNSHISVEYWGLNRKKVDDLGMTKTYSIKRVPTFIFTDNGKEFGRITENPEETVEKDMSTILKNHQ